MAQDVKPNRSELLKTKKQIKLAKSGHKLLQKKRDGLILEFFTLLKKVQSLREELLENYKDAVQKINMARVLETDLKIRSIAQAVKKNSHVKINMKSIMGVSVLNIEPFEAQKTTFERGFGVFNSVSVSEAAKAYEKVIEKIVDVAEYETTIIKILTEIEKTKRRVNGLEFKTIPAMEGVKKFITLRLEEMERENIFRMKRIKA